MKQTELETVALHTNPTEEQLETWRSLSQEEQTASVNKALDNAVASGVSDTTIDDIYQEIFGKPIDG